MDAKIKIKNMENLEWQNVGHDSNRIERMAHSGNDLYVEFKNNGAGYKSVSYTHLTLPTNREV